MGISINGLMGHIYYYEFISFPRVEFNSNQRVYFRLVLWAFVVLCHFIMFILPFLIKKSYFNKALFFAPLTYFVFMGIVNPFYGILLIPALIIWLICFWINKNRKVGDGY
ncbi:hypothetical protein HDF26_004706 [Pedobacter cryoconitis]|nr:hypothetical protein [Pedobacter cryoconitis]